MVEMIAIVGMLVLGFSIWTWRTNRRLVTVCTSPRWCALWRWRWAFAVPLGVASMFLWYPVEADGNRYRVFGMPFMSYAFDQNGYDYVGALSIPALVLNFLTWALLPQPVFWLVFRRNAAFREPSGT